MSGLASPRTDCCVSRNGRIQREWLRHASLRRQVAVTWAAALFITGSTNPFSDPMAAWSFALSHAVASGAAIACGPCECQGSRLVLFARCAQTAPHAQSLSADSGSLPGDSQQGYSLPLPVDAVSHQVPWAGKFAGFHVHFKFGRVRRLWQNRRVRRPCRAALSKRHYCSRVPLTRTRSCRSRVDALPRARRHRRRRPSPRNSRRDPHCGQRPPFSNDMSTLVVTSSTETENKIYIGKNHLLPCDCFELQARSTPIQQ